MLEHTADDRVVCAGVYGMESEKKWKVLGNFLAVFKAGSTESVNTEVIPFNGTGLEGESDEGEDSKSEAKDKGRMTSNTDVIAVLPRSDGSFFLVNEVAYVSIITSTQGGQQVRYVHGPIQGRQGALVLPLPPLDGDGQSGDRPGVQRRLRRQPLPLPAGQ
jgi:hypothetical protein